MVKCAIFSAVKMICIFLSIFVALLSARPCCVDDLCANESSAQKEAPVKQSTPEKECQGCSPFFSCGACAGFIVGKQVTHQTLFVAETIAAGYPPHQQPYLQQITLSIWQPPKIG